MQADRSGRHRGEPGGHEGHWCGVASTARASGPRHAFAAFVSREAGVLAGSGRDARALYVHGIVADLLAGTNGACSGRPRRATLDASI
ncbi:MAG: hypothetical protein QOD76_67 [Solirubrobacteraceae bacterium]|nr:hypothetical protein [Solirubrobacteraceae bacterium]